jgi:hypothetical protein
VNYISTMLQLRWRDILVSAVLYHALDKDHRRRLGPVVVVIVWQLDLQLPMQSVPITTDVVGSTRAQGEVHNIM